MRVQGRQRATRFRSGPVVVGVLAALTIWLVPVPASAHAALLSSDPVDGAVLTAFPQQVVLEFTEEISPPAYAIVTAPDGSPLVKGEVQISGATVLVPTETSDLEGEYTIAFRVVSADGHPISGQVRPSVGSAPTSESVPSAGTGTPAPPGDEEVTPSAAAGPQRSPGSEAGSSRTTWAIGVGAGLFAVAGLLALLSRRART